MLTWVSRRSGAPVSPWSDPAEARQLLLTLSLESSAEHGQALRADFVDFWHPIADLSLRVRGVLFAVPEAGPAEVDLLAEAVLATWVEESQDAPEGELAACCVAAHIKRWSELLPVSQAEVEQQQLGAHLLRYLAGLWSAGTPKLCEMLLPLRWFAACAATLPEPCSTDARFVLLHGGAIRSSLSQELPRLQLAAAASSLGAPAAHDATSLMNASSLTSTPELTAGVGSAVSFAGPVVIGLGLSMTVVLVAAEYSYSKGALRDFGAMTIYDALRQQPGDSLFQLAPVRALRAAPSALPRRSPRVLLARSAAPAPPRPELQLPRELPEVRAPSLRPAGLDLPREGGSERSARRPGGGTVPIERTAVAGVQRPSLTGSLPMEGSGPEGAARPQGLGLRFARRGSARAYFKLPSGLVDSALGRLSHIGLSSCQVTLADGRVVRVQVDEGDLRLSERRGLGASTAYDAVVAVVNGSCEGGR